MLLNYMNKRPPHKTVEELINIGKILGADGFDFCVRPGYPVEPQNVRKRLPEVVKQLKKAGFNVPMLTGTGGMIEANDPLTRDAIVACGEAGIPIFKIGYFWLGEKSLEAQVSSIRKRMEGLSELGRRCKVRICYHTHFGCVGNSSGAMMDLLRDQDPEWLGTYLDTAHLRLAGETLGTAIKVVGPYLAAIALKDVVFKSDRGRIIEKPDLVPVGNGLVDWRSSIQTIKNTTFAGPVVVGCEFVRDTFEEQLEVSGKQFIFLRELSETL